MQDVCITDILDWYLVYFLLTATIDNISGQGATERVLLMVGMETSNYYTQDSLCPKSTFLSDVTRPLITVINHALALIMTVTLASWCQLMMTKHEYHTNISRDRIDDT